MDAMHNEAPYSVKAGASSKLPGMSKQIGASRVGVRRVLFFLTGEVERKLSPVSLRQITSESVSTSLMHSTSESYSTGGAGLRDLSPCPELESGFRLK